MPSHRPTGSPRAPVRWTVASGLLSILLLYPVLAPAEPRSDVTATADRAFQLLDQGLRESPGLHPVRDPANDRSQPYSPDHYLIGTGQGDLSKGRHTCQRIAELAARSELAKQIRVLIKEHAVDRTRERSGHPVEQDVEVTREEIVQEYLQGVKIVDRRIDEPAGVCQSTVIMPRTSLTAAPPSDPRPPTPPPNH